MNLLIIVLMLIVAVLVSNFISKLLPRVATPLVQIALGIVLAFFVPAPSNFELPSDLFMALFVAPLVYSESKNIDRLTAWRNRRTILTLSIGLVVAMTLIVGLLVGSIVPSLPIAAAFVLGAALSPTDAVAVPALAESSSLSKRQRAILSAESIVNDATGVVAFNLALAALLTGSFSVVDAGGSFLVLFFGGIALGIVLGAAANVVSAGVRQLGCDDATFHVLFDVAIPFITFLVGEVAGVSSIMAVMVCALVYRIGIGEAGPDESRMNIVSNSVWNVLSFSLNGIVFVILGFELKASLEDIALSGVSAPELAGASALVVVLIVSLRFLWILVLEHRTRRRAVKYAEKNPKVREEWAGFFQGAGATATRSAAVLTFAGGTKGAITMSVALSIPYSVASRSLTVFLVSVAIIATIVLTNVLVPLLAPAPKHTRSEELEAERRARIGILRRVIERLSADATAETGAATQMVVADYNLRIASLLSGLPEASGVPRRAVRIHALELEAEHCSELMESGEVTDEDGYRYLNRLDRLMSAFDHHSRFRWLLHRNVRRVRSVFRSAFGLMRERLEDLLGIESEKATRMRQLQRRCAQYVADELAQEVANDRFPVEDVTQVMMDYRHAIAVLDAQNPSLTAIATRGIQKEQIQLKGIGYELEGIQDALDAGEIGRETARRMKDGAYLMRLDLENLV